jgi:hypothetical protein
MDIVCILRMVPCTGILLPCLLILLTCMNRDNIVIMLLSDYVTLNIKILKFNMAAFTKLTNSINTALAGFLHPENMGIETEIKSVCASHTEI